MSIERVDVDLAAEAAEMAARLVGEASARDLTLATAESCTGGLVGGAITAVPGSSEAYLGSVVSYAESVKMAVLGVSEATLAAHGAVSSECATEMAEGVRRLIGADVAVSITGIAGPGGAVPGKPVGTVWFGLASGAGTTTLHRHFDGDRDEVRLQSVTQALSLLLGEVVDS